MTNAKKPESESTATTEVRTANLPLIVAAVLGMSLHVFLIAYRDWRIAHALGSTDTLWDYVAPANAVYAFAEALPMILVGMFVGGGIVRRIARCSMRMSRFDTWWWAAVLGLWLVLPLHAWWRLNEAVEAPRLLNQLPPPSILNDE